MNEKIDYNEWKSWEKSSFGNPTKYEIAYFDAILKHCKLNHSSKILEIGFGNGSFLGYAGHKGYSIEGIEVIDELLERAKEKNYKVYRTLDNIDETSMYDLIILLDVLEHIPQNEIPKFLTQLNAHLHHNGAIILRTPNGASPFGLTNQYGDLTHCTIVTNERINYWAKTSGLCISYINGDIYPFIFKHSIAKMPSRLIKLFLYKIIERMVRFVFSPLSKGILSANLFAVLKKTHD